MATRDGLVLRPSFFIAQQKCLFEAVDLTPKDRYNLSTCSTHLSPAFWCAFNPLEERSNKEAPNNLSEGEQSAVRSKGGQANTDGLS